MFHVEIFSITTACSSRRTSSRAVSSHCREHAFNSWNVAPRDQLPTSGALDRPKPDERCSISSLFSFTSSYRYDIRSSCIETWTRGASWVVLSRTPCTATRPRPTALQGYPCVSWPAPCTAHQHNGYNGCQDRQVRVNHRSQVLHGQLHYSSVWHKYYRFLIEQTIGMMVLSHHSRFTGTRINQDPQCTLKIIYTPIFPHHIIIGSSSLCTPVNSYFLEI